MSVHRIVPVEGLSLVAFGDDHPTFPSRLNPSFGQAIRGWRATVVGVHGCEAHAFEVGGTSVLNGTDWIWSWGISPVDVPIPALTGGAGEISWIFTPRHVGLWLLTCWHQDFGSSALPIEVVLG